MTQKLGKILKFQNKTPSKRSKFIVLLFFFSFCIDVIGNFTIFGEGSLLNSNGPKSSQTGLESLSFNNLTLEYETEIDYSYLSLVDNITENYIFHTSQAIKKQVNGNLNVNFGDIQEYSFTYQINQDSNLKNEISGNYSGAIIGPWVHLYPKNLPKY